VNARVYRAISLATAPVAGWFSIEVILRVAIGDLRGAVIVAGYLGLAGATLRAASWRETTT
jgi:hypothetical protein